MLVEIAGWLDAFGYDDLSPIRKWSLGTLLIRVLTITPTPKISARLETKD